MLQPIYMSFGLAVPKRRGRPRCTSVWNRRGVPYQN